MIIFGGIQTVHVARLRNHWDNQLYVTADLKDVLQHALAQGQCAMACIVNVAKAEDGAMTVLVECVSCGADKRSWKPPDYIQGSTPEFVRSALASLRLTREVRTRLRSEFGINM